MAAHYTGGPRLDAPEGRERWLLGWSLFIYYKSVIIQQTTELNLNTALLQ